jgi:DNA-binding beta-propeller fold protein YncE
MKSSTFRIGFGGFLTAVVLIVITVVPTRAAENRNLFVSYGNNTIHEFGPTGADLGTFVSVAPHDPFGLAFDSDDNLYVTYAAGANTIHRFGPTGADLGTFVNTGSDSSPVFLAFAPVAVPEPASALLILLGVSMIVLRSFRRSHTRGVYV